MKITSDLSVPQGHPDMPKKGNTSLSIKAAGGHVWLVDQNGLQVKGVISVSASTSVDSLTTMRIECYSHDNGDS